MSCEKDKEESETFKALAKDLSAICKTYSDHLAGVHPCKYPAEYFDAQGLSFNYFAQYTDNYTIEFQCLTNFKLESGNLTSRCLPNGSWSGREPVCVVDGFRTKENILGIIVFGSLIFATVVFIIDFILWRCRKNVFRQKKILQVKSVRIASQMYQYKQQYLAGDIPYIPRVSLVMTKAGEDIIAQMQNRHRLSSTSTDQGRGSGFNGGDRPSHSKDKDRKSMADALFFENVA